MDEEKKDVVPGSPDVIDNATNKVEKLGKFFTALKKLLWNHWGMIILCGVGYFFYWAFTNPAFSEPPAITEIHDTVFVDHSVEVSPEVINTSKGEEQGPLKSQSFEQEYSDSQYYVGVSEGVQYGPYTMKQLHGFIYEGSITLNTALWKEGLEAWTFAKDIPEVNELFR